MADWVAFQIGGLLYLIMPVVTWLAMSGRQTRAGMAWCLGGLLMGLGMMAFLAKSMRTDPAFLRRGLGEAMLVHLIADARSRGYARLSLETELPEPFHPAHALYAKHGFERCAPFGDYTEDPFSMCMTRTL